MSSLPMIKLTIDNQEIEVAPTKIAYDPQYKKQIEIPTTIYDAAQALCQRTGEVNPIPVLCHREHVNPVAVCRVCVVDVVGGRVLTPACQRAVEPGMKVLTAKTSKRVESAIKVVTELLLADQPANPEKHEGSNPNELLQLASRLKLDPEQPRFPRRGHDRGHDDSSLVIAVDHNACILCDRCVRGCNEIRNNQVLGRAGKGYTATIAFDLNEPMGESSCVACGECMISCPTGALTFRKPVKAHPLPDFLGTEKVTAAALAQLPLFEGVSVKFLEWNANSVVRRRFRAGDVICKEGEFGSSAFYIESGRVDVRLQSTIKHTKSRKSKADRGHQGFFGLIQRITTNLVSRSEDSRDEESRTGYIHIDAPVALKYGNPVAELRAGDLFGEMTCMNSYPRSATVRGRRLQHVGDSEQRPLHSSEK